jgi:hypothetical protein
MSRDHTGMGLSGSNSLPEQAASAESLHSAGKTPIGRQDDDLTSVNGYRASDDNGIATISVNNG